MIHEAQCGCLFIYDDAARWWERCDDHPDDYGPDGCLGMKEDE